MAVRKSNKTATPKTDDTPETELQQEVAETQEVPQESTDTTETQESTDTTETQESTEDKDFTAYASKVPTSLHRHYREWLLEKTGWTPANATEDEMDKAIQLAVSLYQKFQKSPEHKAWREQEQARKAAQKPAKGKGLTPDQIRKQIEALQAQLAEQSDSED